MRPLKKEVQAVAAAISGDHESAERAAEAAIQALDRARSERVTYHLVLRFGSKGNAFFQSFGPYSTANQAEKAYEKHPASGMATGRAVVPTVNDIGLDELIARVDAPAASRGDWPEVKQDAEAFRNGWKGKARTRKDYLR